MMSDDIKKQLCVNCKWFAEFEGVCCNGGSDNCAAFMWNEGDTCEKWEEFEHEDC